jgi:hypothetical protein
MKKILVMLAVAFIVSSAVWAQIPNTSPKPASPFPELNAVQTSSVEKEYSAGLFDSDVDNYIDPTFFDGQIGTFMFAGGFHGDYNGTAFNDYDLTTPPGATTDDTISVGFAKTLGADKYLAAYYGGSLVNAYGTFYEDPAGKLENASTRDAVWRNKLAVLFGLGNMGFRLDLIMDNTTDHTDDVGGKVAAQTVGSAPTLAISWGTIINEKIAPWVKVGFKFPDTEVKTDAAITDRTDVADKTGTWYSDARLALNAGASIDLNETSSLCADLTIGGILPTSVKGDKDIIGTDEYDEGGTFGANLYVDFTKALTFGEYVTVKLRPNLGLDFISVSTNNSEADEEYPSSNWFSLGMGIDVGGEYRYDKIALYTGLGLRFFQWDTLGFAGGDEDHENKNSYWEFRGLAWDPDKFGNSTGTLRFGLTFAPLEGLVFGTGLAIGAVFDPVTMNVTPNTNVAGTSGYQIWANTKLSITVSYKIPYKPKEPKEEAEEVEEAKE